MLEEEHVIKSDRIEREVVIAASQERVWTAITDPSEVSKWFGDIVEIELYAGGGARFGWTEDTIIHAIVEAVEPFRRFVYRWAAEDGVSVADGPSTLVEFTLDGVAGGTRVTMVESGFADLPPEIYDATLAENQSGWRTELADLVEFMSVPQGA